MAPLMPKATAVWLVDNTTLTFDQIAEFTGMHPLEISGIADGEVAVGIKGFDPITNNQLARSEIDRCQADPKARLRLLKAVTAPAPKKKAPRYTPLSKRLDRPAAIAWLVRNHPELADAQITKLLGTTKQTIQAIREKRHWNSQGIQPVDPVALGLCRQIDLDAAVRLASERKAKEEAAAAPTVAAGDGALKSTDETLDAPAAAKRLTEFESIALDGMRPEDGAEDAGAPFGDAPSPFGDMPDPEPSPAADAPLNPDDVFNLPKGGDAEEEETEPGR